MLEQKARWISPWSRLVRLPALRPSVFSQRRSPNDSRVIDLPSQPSLRSHKHSLNQTRIRWLPIALKAPPPDPGIFFHPIPTMVSLIVYSWTEFRERRFLWLSDCFLLECCIESSRVAVAAVSRLLATDRTRVKGGGRGGDNGRNTVTLRRAGSSAGATTIDGCAAVLRIGNWTASADTTVTIGRPTKGDNTDGLSGR